MIHHITFNGKTGNASIATPWIQALSNPRIVTEKAGFLFKVSLNNDRLELAVCPCLINGERSYHFNMHLKQEDAYTLIGDVNAQGVFTILFKPETRVLSEEQKKRYINVFRQFALFLTEAGYRGEGRLDEVTRGVLATLGLSPAPQTLSDFS